jgi:hypothetical protein
MKDEAPAPFSAAAAVAFRADGERQVSAGFPLWFRKGGRGRSDRYGFTYAINGKFTENQNGGVFC